VGEQTIAAIIGTLVGGGIIIAAVLVIAFIIFRDAISSAVKDRLQKFDYSRGDTKLSVDLSSPTIPAKPSLEVQSQSGTQQLEPPANDSAKQIEEITDSAPKTSTEWEKELFAELQSDKPDFARAEESFLHVQAEELNSQQKVRNEVIYWYLRQKKGDSEAIDKLKELPEKAKDFPNVVGDIYIFIGLAYIDVGGWTQALDAFNSALHKAITPKDKATAVRQIAIAQMRLGRPEEALSILRGAIVEVQDTSALAALYRGLATYYEERKDYEERKEFRLQALALEKSLEYDANDTDIRFQTAMAYSEANMHELSLLHYMILLQTLPHYAYALNNMGVQYSQLKMPTLAVSAYRRSIEQGNTLSSSNLANVYIDAGLIEDGRRILDEAMKQEDVHKNIPASFGRLSQQQIGDENLRDDAVKRAQEQQQFSSDFAQAYFVNSDRLIDLSCVWKTSDGTEFMMTQRTNSLRAEWERYGRIMQLEGTLKGEALTDVKLSSKDKGGYFSTTTFENGEGFISSDGGIIRILATKGNENIESVFERTNSVPV